MKILITGGTGLLGSYLTQSLLHKEHEIYVLTRSLIKAKTKLDSAVNIIEDLEDEYKFDAIINLAGENLNQKWTESAKQIFMDSRIIATQKIVEYIHKAKYKPEILISGSAIGYYGHDYNQTMVEDVEPLNSGFTNKLCKAWEEGACKLDSTTTRLCIIRTGVVLSSAGGALREMIVPFKYGLGATLGNGRQYVSWIHIEDFAKSIEFLLENKKAKGVFNLTSPNPVTQNQLASTLAKLMKRPHILRLPDFIVELIFGEMGKTLLLEGSKVLPKKLTEEGYKFRYPDIISAISDLLNR